jgi:hypothetical protein
MKMKIRIQSVSYSADLEPEIFSVRLLLEPDDGYEGVFMGETVVTIPFDSELTFPQIEQKAIAEAKRVI